MKVIILDDTGIVYSFSREIRDWSTLDYELVMEEISGYITNDCEVRIYHEHFNKDS